MAEAFKDRTSFCSSGATPDQTMLLKRYEREAHHAPGHQRRARPENHKRGTDLARRKQGENEDYEDRYRARPVAPAIRRGSRRRPRKTVTKYPAVLTETERSSETPPKSPVTTNVPIAKVPKAR